MTQPEYELQDFSQSQDAPAASGFNPASAAALDESTSTWAWAASSIMALLSMLFALSPRFLLFLSQSSSLQQAADLTPLEQFLAVHFGIWLASIALGILINIPGDNGPSRNQGPTPHPLLIPTTIAGLLSSILSWNTSDIGSLSSVFSVATGTVGIWSLWVLVFGSTQYISRKTGADKHTSSFLFGNRSAASKLKKSWRNEQKDKDS